MTSYIYTKISDLVSDQKNVNLCGVVKYFRPPTLTRTGDYNAMYTLIDPSLEHNIENGIRCNLFGHQKDELPLVEIGDIIRFHRMTVSQYNNRLQMKKTRGYSWLVYDSQNFDINKPKSSHPNPTILDEDKARIHEMRSFFLRIKDKIVDDVSAVVMTSLCHVHLETFFNCRVQVISVHVFRDSENYALLYVSDGTAVCYSSLRHNGIINSSDETDLSKATRNYTFEISVFDDHVADVINLHPGDFVELINVHAKSVSQFIVQSLKDKLRLHEVDESNGWMELVVHTGKRYNRGVKIIPSDDSIKEKISDLLKQYKARATMTNLSSQPMNKPLQVSYTTTDFPFKKCTPIVDIYDANVPNKFKVKVKVINIYPNDIKEFIVGMCEQCNSLTQVPEYVICKNYNSSMMCPDCKDELLRLTYTFKLLVSDDTGVIEVNVHDKEALYFFNNTKPSSLIQDENLLINFKNKLQKLVGGGNLLMDDTDDRDHKDLPFIELCVFSYTAPAKIAYHLFSTSLI